MQMVAVHTHAYTCVYMRTHAYTRIHTGGGGEARKEKGGKQTGWNIQQADCYIQIFDSMYLGPYLCRLVPNDCHTEYKK